LVKSIVPKKNETEEQDFQANEFEMELLARK